MKKAGIFLLSKNILCAEMHIFRQHNTLSVNFMSLYTNIMCNCIKCCELLVLHRDCGKALDYVQRQYCLSYLGLQKGQKFGFRKPAFYISEARCPTFQPFYCIFGPLFLKISPKIVNIFRKWHFWQTNLFFGRAPLGPTFGCFCTPGPTMPNIYLEIISENNYRIFANTSLGLYYFSHKIFCDQTKAISHNKTIFGAKLTLILCKHNLSTVYNKHNFLNKWRDLHYFFIVMTAAYIPGRLIFECGLYSQFVGNWNRTFLWIFLFGTKG